MDKLLKFGLFALAITTIASASPAARAAERVTLSNGFTLTCNHHAVADGHVRIYTSADASSYIEFPASDVVSVEAMSNPPGPPTATGSTATVKTAPQDLHEILTGAGHQHNLDVDLLASVVKAESGGNPRARSRAGAQGLMQLMPGTAAELGVKDSYIPDQNVGGGSAYLDGLLTRYHENLALALAAYNAGPGAVDRYPGIPPYRETQLYVARVIREFNRRVKQRDRQAAKVGATDRQQLASGTR